MPRRHISALGNDANPCTRPAPCRTLQVAHNNTNAGGEINMLDPAAYGIVTITKAISIVNDGVGSAGILVPAAQTGITINAAATDKINLRGLIIEGAGLGLHGLVLNTARSLTVENCVIRNATSEGVLFSPTGASRIFMSDTDVSGNGGRGITLEPSGVVAVKAVFNQVRLHRNVSSGLAVVGLSSTGTIDATVTDSVSSSGGGAGYFAVSDTGQAATSLMVFRSVAANNGTGLSSQGANATLRVSQSTLSGNNNGWSAPVSGSLLSAADNTIEGNGGGETAPPTYTKK